MVRPDRLARLGRVRPLERVLVCLAAGFLGCAPAVPMAGPDAQPPWRTLFDGTDMDAWIAVQGDAKLENKTILLNAASRRSTIVARRALPRNATVEVKLRRRKGPDDNAPYTIALRLGGILDWGGVYFVCRPRWAEVCRGSAADPHPKTVRFARYDPARDRPEVWRFVMNEGDIECRRFGQRVHVFDDQAPKSGRIALTADGCLLEVLEVRYLPGRSRPSP